MRKSVPFDVQEARIAVRCRGGSGSTLVAAIARPVLEGYEAACRALGLTPGIVELTGPGLLTAAFGGLPPADRLLVNWDEGYLTLMLARGAWPLAHPYDHGSARRPRRPRSRARWRTRCSTIATA